MRRFVFDICIVLVVLALLFVSADIYLSFHITNSYAYKECYMQEHKNDIKTLLLGNSYFENSLNPHFLGDSVFDLAISGRWIYYDDLLVQKYVPQMPNLKYVIIPLGYSQTLNFSYHYNVLDDIQRDYVFRYAKYMHLDYDRFPQSIWLGSSLLNGKYQMDEIFPQTPYSCDSIGYDKIEGQLEGWDTIHNVNPEEFMHDFTPYISEYIYYLGNIAKICTKYNVKLIVVTTPFNDVYLLNTLENGWKAVYSVVTTVSKQYPIEYLDYHDDDEFREDSLWYNCSHLNHVGATMFAKRLYKDAHLCK